MSLLYTLIILPEYIKVQTVFVKNLAPRGNKIQNLQLCHLQEHG